jgi:hypothetical protein
MVLEAFQDFDQRIRLDIIGHSGETHSIPFVTSIKNLPRDNKQRLEVIKVISLPQYIIKNSGRTLYLFFN